jgi:myo-inositol 2-dehydrogenase / D-chiro-inositol 1-dehydrogenase
MNKHDFQRVTAQKSIRLEVIMKTFGVALLGAGRMGMEHARNLAGMPQARVIAVADPNLEAAELARVLARGERTYARPEDAIADPAVEVVLICTPTPTHAPLTELAARAGKAVFCEKPIALDLAETLRVMAIVEETGIPFQIGFQRRYDVAFADAKRRIEAGALGQLEQFRAVGRDPAPPPLEYLKISGGIFCDQAIHDIDIARFLVGEVEEVSVWGAVRVDPQIAEIGDADTVTSLLRFENGALGVMENSRRAVYGYDVRSEVFGSGGKIVIDATPKTPIQQFGVGGVNTDHYYFFMDRFIDAYRIEIAAFFASLESGMEPTPGPRDAIESLRIALAMTRSLHEKRPVKLSEMRLEGEGT